MINKIAVVVIATFVTLVAVVAQQSTDAPSPLNRILAEQSTDAPSPLALSPETVESWTLIASRVGPNVPAGWQLIGVEEVISNGNSINRWQLFFYKPTTRQTMG